MRNTVKIHILLHRPPTYAFDILFESMFAAELNVTKKPTTQSLWLVKNDQQVVKNSTFYKNTLFESIFTPESNVNKISPTEIKYVVKNDHKVCQTS